MRYFIYLSYKGTNYHGWQVQANAHSVQRELEHALSIVLGEKIETTGAGRTDTGVHATSFVAHFDSQNYDLVALDLDVVKKLNCILPTDICIYEIKAVKDNAHARFDATQRTYKYYISTKKNPFNTEFSSYIPYQLNIDAMNEAAQVLFEYNDFMSFAKLHSQTKTTICRITFAKWETTDGGLVFTISADRFLRNMVRSIVGTLIDVGRGKISIDEMRKIIEQKDRCKAGTSVPAKGLFLTEILY